MLMQVGSSAQSGVVVTAAWVVVVSVVVVAPATVVVESVVVVPAAVVVDPAIVVAKMSTSESLNQ